MEVNRLLCEFDVYHRTYSKLIEIFVLKKKFLFFIFEISKSKLFFSHNKFCFLEGKRQNDGHWDKVWVTHWKTFSLDFTSYSLIRFVTLTGNFAFAVTTAQFISGQSRKTHVRTKNRPNKNYLDAFIDAKCLKKKTWIFNSIDWFSNQVSLIFCCCFGQNRPSNRVRSISWRFQNGRNY